MIAAMVIRIFAVYMVCSVLAFADSLPEKILAAHQLCVQGRTVEGEQAYLLVLGEAQDAGLPEVQLGTVFSELGNIYCDQASYSLAETYFQRALAIWEKALGRGDRKVAATLDNLGFLYQHLGRYPEAETVLRRALAIEHKVSEGGDLETATILNNLGEVLRITNNG